MSSMDRFNGLQSYEDVVRFLKTLLYSYDDGPINEPLTLKDAADYLWAIVDPTP